MLEKSAHLSSVSKSPGGFAYQRHKSEETDLYKIIEQNLPSFQSHLSNADISLPAFVHQEFRSYLRCGLLKHGFLRVKCDGCRFEHLVAFSCKLRGFCPSCSACCMVETSAHLYEVPTSIGYMERNRTGAVWVDPHQIRDMLCLFPIERPLYASIQEFKGKYGRLVGHFSIQNVHPDII